MPPEDSPPGSAAEPARERTVTWDDPLILAAAASGRAGLDFVQGIVSGELPPPPIARTLGFEMVAVSRGFAEFALEPAEFHYNPIGSVHGGVYAALLDSAAGCAVQTTLPAGTAYTSLDLSVKFLGAIRIGTGRVTCTGTVIHRGRRTALAEARLCAADGKLLAFATSSCLILSPDHPSASG
jgi:uncharacterized protein (TIGR00369 family)